MWPRVVEVMLGFWLMMSPFVFRAEVGGLQFFHDLGVGFLVMCLSLLSFWPRTSRSHLFLIAVGLWLVAFGWQNHPAPPARQSDLVTGILLLMFAILPNHNVLPPEDWRYHGRRLRRL